MRPTVRVRKLEVRGVASATVRGVEATGDISVETSVGPGGSVTIDAGRYRGWVRIADGCWRHAPWWKVAINKVLRFFQTRRRPARLLVLATVCDETHESDDVPPRATGYALRRVLHL